MDLQSIKQKTKMSNNGKEERPQTKPIIKLINVYL